VDSDVAPVSAESDRAVVRWLVVCAMAVALAVAIGGITRLTESGLSITQWKPVSGVIPPLTTEAWTDAYDRYLKIPEAQTVHRGITMSEFRSLFWWEWAHRVLARVVGLVLAVPFFVLLIRRRIRPGLRLRLMNLPLLAALQGAMGWYMVQSGLSGRTSVSPYRLVAHLAVALVIFGIAVWTAAELSGTSAARERFGAPRSRRLAFVVSLSFAALAFATMLSGGFVAGLDAGKVFNTFPLMEGRLIPAGYDALGGWRNAFENPVAAQLHHRLLAIGTAVLIWGAWLGAMLRSWPLHARRGLAVASAVTALQVTLGIGTLLLSVPVLIAVLHQLTGLALFAVLLTLSQRLREMPLSTGAA
jgi:cytochrome c oxidase assembly protein subunit 15